MTIEEAYKFIVESNKYGSVLGLSSMKTLLARLGNPQEKLKFVHVAGTNGKGTTGAYISAILAAAGYYVGRYISPAVLNKREIIQISYKHETSHMISRGNDQKKDIKFDKSPEIFTKYISEKDIAYYIERIQKACISITEEGLPHPTIFEIETAMSFLYFLDSKCDIVVLEVGLGGRLDATNVISTAECAVLTSISMDHMHILGNTLEEIAREKAGIIKPGFEVISYEQKPEARKVIEEVCKEMDANVTFADFNNIKIERQDLKGTIFSYEEWKHLHINLLGENQIKNAVTALLTIKTLQSSGYSITEKDIYSGLLNARWRGRFEILKKEPLFIVDGAHNEDAAVSLARNINIYLKSKKIIYIMGVLADKDYDAVLKHTGKYASAILTITPNNSRGLSSKVLAQAASQYCSTVYDCDRVSEAVEMAYNIAGENDVIVAFGSLSYLEEVYQALDITME
jgi:dihydrofolate synthase/folylpolyglutamate synthase